MADDFGHIIRNHENIITVPEAMTSLYNQYIELGYRIHLKLPSSFSFYEDDETIKLIYWKEGKIYEGLSKYKALKKDRKEL